MIDELNLEAIHYYLSYRHVPRPMSAVKGKERALIAVRCPSFTPSLELSEDQIVDRLEELLVAGVKKLLEKPIAIITSGGLDSGLVTAIAAKLSLKPIRTFCLTYSGEEPEGERRDREYSRAISEIYGTKHTEIQVTFNRIWACLPKILYTIGEPFSGYVTPWFIGEGLHHYGVTLVMTGDWGDELFGSYKAHRLAYKHPYAEPWLLRATAFVFYDSEKTMLYSKEMREKTKGISSLGHLRGYFEMLTAKDSLNRMLESEFRSFYPDHTFLSFYLLTSYWGVSVVSPYAQPEFADFAARIPGEIKMHMGETKYILKRLAEKYLPKEIVHRQKKGFVTSTMPLCLALENQIRGALSLDSLKRHNLFDSDYIQSLVDNFYGNPTEQLSYKLWNLVCLQVWGESCGLW